MTLRSDSERWFVACWPAIITLLAGWFLFLDSVAKERRDLSRRIGNQGPIENQRALLASANEDLAAVTRDMERLAKEIEEKRLGFDRGVAMRRVSLLCEELKLQIGEVKTDTSAKHVPVALRQAVAKLPNKDGSPPQVWHVQLEGSFPSVMKLLQSLASSSPMMVPLNLTMESDPKERRQPVWNLYLWL